MPYVRSMAHDTRLEIRMPAQRRQELDRLADEVGVPISTLMRLATTRLIEDRQELLEMFGATEGRAA